MDIVTLAMAKPKVIKLADFHDSDGRNLNNVILEMLMTSINNSGEWQQCSFVGEDSLRVFVNLKRGKQYAFEFMVNNEPRVTNASIAFDEFLANQIVIEGALFHEGVPCSYTAAIIRSNFTVSIFVKGVVLS